MMVVLKRTYAYILMRFLSVCALVFAVGLAKVQHTDAAIGIDTTSIQNIFEDASMMKSGHKKLAITTACYSQSYYQAYYQGSYNITFSNTVAAKGNLTVTTNMGKGSGTFVIDHPLDPLNKLLYHSFVESPDAKNIYDGIATLDKDGKAVIRLPAYFDALNGDVRYQLKPIGVSMPDLYVSQEEKDNAFAIAGGVPGGQVSWQITGTRHDAYILANPITVEVEKGPDQVVDRGTYLFPDGYAPTLADFFARIGKTISNWLPR